VVVAPVYSNRRRRRALVLPAEEWIDAIGVEIEITIDEEGQLATPVPTCDVTSRHENLGEELVLHGMPIELETW